MKKEDTFLIRRILKGDETASNTLFSRYARGLYRYLYFRTGQREQDAQDLTQKVFINAWKGLETFDLRRDFWAWLCGIAIRCLSRYYRDNRRPAGGRNADLSVCALAETLSDKDPLPVEILEKAEAREVMEKALSGLDPLHQKLLDLKYRIGRSAAEIAGELGITATAVNSSLQRARAALRMSIDSYKEELLYE